jgi:transcription antitermination protein NusB
VRLERRKTRELAVQILFQVEVGRLPLEEVLATAKEEMPEDAHAWGSVSPAEWEYIGACARGIAEHGSELDGIIARLAEGWSLERIANVDRITLRLALFEMLHRDTPAPVVINAAVDIVKKYSTEDSGRFVNGILGAFLRERRAAAGDAKV